MLLRLNRHIDELLSVYKFYSQHLKANNLQALLFYGAGIFGCLLYLFLMQIWYKPDLWLGFIVVYQIALSWIGYNYFRDMYLDEHSPK